MLRSRGDVEAVGAQAPQALPTQAASQRKVKDLLQRNKRKLEREERKKEKAKEAASKAQAEKVGVIICVPGSQKTGPANSRN
jgi:hypothetical protein